MKNLRKKIKTLFIACCFPFAEVLEWIGLWVTAVKQEPHLHISLVAAKTQLPWSLLYLAFWKRYAAYFVCDDKYQWLDYAKFLCATLSFCICTPTFQTGPVRFLEAHMASLRQAFDTWMDSEPEELETDRPTDAEMTAFEEAEKNHTKQVSRDMSHHFL